MFTTTFFASPKSISLVHVEELVVQARVAGRERLLTITVLVL
jgi:hypothetical protein